MGENSIIDILYVFVVMILVILLAYFVSKWLGKRYMTQGQKTKNMTVVDRLPLGQNQSVVMIKCGEKAMLLGVTPQHIEKLCDISSDELAIYQQNTPQPSSFSATFSRVLKNGANSNKNNTPSEEEETGSDQK